MPFVVRSLGWGCMCPDYYIGVSPNTQEGPWISVIAPDDFPVSDTKGYSLIVTGVFTGDSVEEDFRNEDGEPEEWLYKMPEFKIHNWKENRMDYDVPAPKVILNKSQPEGTKILGSWKLNDLYVNSEKRNIDTSQLIVWDFTPDRKLTSSITSSEEPMRWHTTKDSIFITDSEFPDEKIIGTWKVEEVLLTLDLVMNDKSKRRLIFRRKTGILETQ